jgi:hypothetical protein
MSWKSLADPGVLYLRPLVQWLVEARPGGVHRGAGAEYDRPFARFLNALARSFD